MLSWIKCLYCYFGQSVFGNVVNTNCLATLSHEIALMNKTCLRVFIKCVF